jgi:predicted TPR repeat methyltransferase
MNEFLERGERFDMVVIANVHVEPGKRAKLFAQASNALALGGHLFLVGHHVSSLGKAGPKQPERLYTDEVLKVASPELGLLRMNSERASMGTEANPPRMSFSGIPSSGVSDSAKLVR